MKNSIWRSNVVLKLLGGKLLADHLERPCFRSIQAEDSVGNKSVICMNAMLFYNNGQTEAGAKAFLGKAKEVNGGVP